MRPSGEALSPRRSHTAARRRYDPGASRIAWYVSLIAVAAMLVGCADVTVKNPQTGATETCQQSLLGLDPWSQTDACVAEHMAQGWTRVDEK